jgi:large conductance mechanosensitive channel
MTKEELEELTQIRKSLKALEAALVPAPPPPPPKGLVNEFKHFLSEYKVMGLAVAFIMGLYLGQLVSALVADLVMPIVNIFLPPGLNIADWEVGPFYLGLQAIGPFLVGHFLNELITFLIIAFVIFLLIKLTSRFGIE